MFIVSNGISGGVKAGFASALGVAVGTTIHVIAAVVGLSLLVQENPFVFDIIKYVGAAYLAYLAAKTWINASNATINGGRSVSVRQAFQRGIVSNLLNPKVIIFIFAFIPQFIPAYASDKNLLFAYLGGIFILGTIIFDGAAGIVSGMAREVIIKWFENSKVIDRFSACVLFLICVSVFLV